MWWPLTRHFQVVERLPANGFFLEANSLGRWQPIAARREALVLAFPRTEAAAAASKEQEAASLAHVLALGEAGLDGAAAELARARASADEAAEARRHPPHRQRCGERAPQPLRPERALLHEAETQ